MVQDPPRTPQGPPGQARPVVAVVGVCAAGKSTLARGLQELGFTAYAVPQEHSVMQRLWLRRKPDLLVMLDAEWATTRRRRPDIGYGPDRLEEQRRRLRYAREECDLYLPTDHLTIAQVRQQVLDLIHQWRVGRAVSTEGVSGQMGKQPVDAGAVGADPEVQVLIAKAQASLLALGFTEHGMRHVGLVAERARGVLQALGYPERQGELAAIAALLHDIGNLVNREGHGQTGAILAHGILTRLGMPVDQIADVMTAIGNHEEQRGEPVNTVAAALILADKSDVHHTRVQNPDIATFDIHDRVNYAARHSELVTDAAARAVALRLEIDTEIVPIMEYFEIFLTRMVMCRRAAQKLGCHFELIINGTRLL